MRQISVLTYFLLTISFCQAQRIGTLYYGVSSDSLHRGHQIEFKNDSALELSSFPRHMSQQFRLTLTYKRTGKALKVYNTNISKGDSIALINHGFNQYLNNTILTIEEKALTDDLNKLVYVLHKDFKRKYYLIYLIDGKKYKQETGLSDSYGLINNKTKENKVLKDKMTSMKDDLNNYDLKIYKGLDAYRKFGYESVFGVIELKRKM
jgi:hypothetical protein